MHTSKANFKILQHLLCRGKRHCIISWPYICSAAICQ